MYISQHIKKGEIKTLHLASVTCSPSFIIYPITDAHILSSTTSFSHARKFLAKKFHSDAQIIVEDLLIFMFILSKAWFS